MSDKNSDEVEKMVKPPPEAFLEAYFTDSTVNQMHKSGADLFEIIAALAAEKKKMWQRIVYLKEIAPFKVMHPDGSFVIFRCPDELIPVAWEEEP